MKTLRFLAPVFLCLSAPSSAPARPSDVHRFELPNGLTVLVRVEPRLPLVNLTCMYRVGGANERAGITGMAHFIEHMAFRSTENISQADITGTIERLGGRWNGYTWIDQTLYAATVPAWALETVLRIEAERMSRVRFDPTDFERERTSIIAELQGYENDPASILYDLAVASSFELHPYRFNVIGWLTDVLSIRPEEAHQFYKDFYGPNSAVLTVVGDVDPENVRRLVEAQFGPLRPSERSPQVRVVEPPQKGEKRMELRHPGSQKNLILAYRAPRAADADFPLLVLTDVLLAGGRGLLFGSRKAPEGSRLQKAIEAAGGIEASTSWTPSRAPYVYIVSVSAGSSTDLRGLEDAVQSTLDRLKTEGPSEAELERSRRQVRAEFAYQTETLAEVAHQMATFESLGYWQMADTILHSMNHLSASDVRRFIDTYLQPERRTVGWHIPSEAGLAPSAEIPRLNLPDPVIPPPSPVPDRALEPLPSLQLNVTRETLDNGMSMGAAEAVGQTAAAYLRLGFGSALDPPGKEGLALLGARTLVGDSDLVSQLAEVGARMTTSAMDSPTVYTNRESIDVEIQFLPDDLPTVVSALGRALQNHDWSDEELERLKAEMGEEITALASDAVWVSEQKAVELVDPTWHPPLGTERSIESITAEDVRGFLSSHLVGSALHAGLVHPDPATALQIAKDVFSGIPSGKMTLLRIPASQPVASKRQLIAVEGKSQAEIVGALLGVERGHPDEVAVRLLSYILGETGYAGRLGRKLVNTGLAYSVYVAPQPGRLRGPILIQTATASANLEESLSRIEAVLTDLSSQGVSESEWREAQAYRLGRLVVGVESTVNLARALVEADYFGVDPLDLPARSKEILAVSRQRLNEVARLYFGPDALRLAVAGAVR